MPRPIGRLVTGFRSELNASSRPTWRATCRAGNAYNPSLALRAAFNSTANRCRADDERVPSAWEPTGWEELPQTRTLEKDKRAESRQQEPPKIRSIASNWPERVARKRLRQQAAKEHAADNEQGDRIQERAPPNEDSPHQNHARHVLLAHARKASQNGRPYELDMSDRQYWIGPRYRKQVVDAEGWKAAIGNLVALNRQLHEDRQNGRRLTADDRELMRAAFDYLPRAVLPRAPPAKNSSLPPTPWDLNFPGGTNTTLQGEEYAKHELSREISRFATFMKPTRLERIARQVAKQEVLDMLRAILAAEVKLATEVEIHGSEKTGLAMPTSDIDIRIWAEDTASTELNKYAYAKTMRARLSVIHRALKKDPAKFGLVTMRGEGMHPIINFQHRSSGIDFQIVATDTAEPQEKVTRNYLAKFEGLHDLFIVVRTALEVRGLLPVHNGGTGSYGCFVMLLPPLLRRVDTDSYTVSMLRRFLSFYDPCDTINPARHGVSCHPRQVFLKHKPDAELNKFRSLALSRGDLVRAGQWKLCQRNELQPYLLTIQDPANPNNDLGARALAIQHIIATFVRLRADLKHWTRKTTDHEKYKPFLSTIVGRPDLLYQTQRKILREYGRTALSNGFTLPETSDSAAIAPSPIRRTWTRDRTSPLPES
ncbi:putative Nucleotidyltransferase superfamily, nucleotidyltransferase Trf4 [Septoria linicola]|nr:putative Nucleotidyltransferase superfamily, nucleotidyltransferase Trf4 [Septoria linicola]